MAAEEVTVTASGRIWWGLVEQDLADEVGFVDETNDGGGATQKAMLYFALCDGAGDGE